MIKPFLKFPADTEFVSFLVKSRTRNKYQKIVHVLELKFVIDSKMWDLVLLLYPIRPAL